MPRDEDYSRKKLERLMPIFYHAAVKGVREVLDDYPRHGHKHRTNTRRSIVRDHIVDHLRADLMTDPEVSIKEKNQTTYFGICSEFRLLAKRATPDGLVALNSNQSSFAFQDNRQSIMFASADLPADTTNIYLSYSDNPIDPREPFVYLICPKEDGYHWRIEIEPPAAAEVVEIKRDTPPDDGDDMELIRIPEQPKPDTSET